MTNAFGPGLLGTICTLDYWILGLQLAGKMNVFVWLMKRINIHCKSDQSSRHSLSHKGRRTPDCVNSEQ